MEHGALGQTHCVSTSSMDQTVCSILMMIIAIY